MIEGGRYFLIGDEGYVDEKERFHLVGRGGGYVINTGGEKIYSEEVEEIIKRNPKVKDSAVIGLSDERWGEVVTAIVELEKGERTTEDEIREYCKEKMAGYKVPKNVVFHKVLRTDVGKIMVAELREIATEELEKSKIKWR